MNRFALAIVSTLRESLLVLDAELRIQAASRFFYEHFQVSERNTVGRPIYEIGNGEWDIPALRKLLEDILPDEEGHFDDYELEHRFEKLGRRILLLNGRRMEHGGEHSRFILLAIEDVTERRRAWRQAELQRQWLHTTLSSIGDAVIATDADAAVTFMNPTAEKITQWKQEEAAGRPLEEVFNIINEETRRTVESPVTKAIRMDAIVGLANHTLLIARDGSEHPIDDSAAPIRDDAGNIEGVVLVFHDIAERRASERKLEVSESRYRRLFEAAQDGILILDDPGGRILDVNRFLTDLLHYPREHFLGKQLWEIGVFADIEENQRAMEQLRRTGSIHFEDLLLEDRDGRHHPVEFISSAYREDSIRLFQCNLRDIGGRKQMEQERRTLLAQEHAARVEAQAAERANRAKDVFLATLSHEMRTPLNAILGWASLLSEGQRDPEDLKEGLAVIHRNARTQAQLIEDVLDVSRIVSGKLSLEMRSADLNAVAQSALQTVRPSAAAKGITLEVKPDPSALQIQCDPPRLQQVIWNLLSNAIKFSPAGSTIRLKLDRHGSRARIQIADEGEGIPADALPYIFDRFRQADSSTRRKTGGLGLGLSIVKTLVEMHGGTVQAHSDGEGAGTLFTVTLPIGAVREKDLAAERRKGRKGALPVRLEGVRVLVVDDEPDARRLVAKVLEDVGAQVHTAASAAEAMAALTDGPWEVLVSDIAMPEADGYDLIHQVRSAGHTPRQLPAIALTAFAHKEDQRRALLAGFQMHLAKPVDPHDLIVTVASLAGRTGQ